jgi:hypothetical protein
VASAAANIATDIAVSIAAPAAAAVDVVRWKLLVPAGWPHAGPMALPAAAAAAAVTTTTAAVGVIVHIH